MPAARLPILHNEQVWTCLEEPSLGAIQWCPSWTNLNMSRGRSLKVGVQSNAPWVMVTWGPLWTDRTTDRTENITFATLLAGGKYCSRSRYRSSLSSRSLITPKGIWEYLPGTFWYHLGLYLANSGKVKVSHVCALQDTIYDYSTSSE